VVLPGADISVLYVYYSAKTLPSLNVFCADRYAYAKYNLSLGVGLSQVAGKVFRIGHLGNMDEVRLQDWSCTLPFPSAGLPAARLRTAQYT